MGVFPYNRLVISSPGPGTPLGTPKTRSPYYHRQASVHAWGNSGAGRDSDLYLDRTQTPQNLPPALLPLDSTITSHLYITPYPKFWQLTIVTPSDSFMKFLGMEYDAVV